jgi:hypothetical protein
MTDDFKEWENKTFKSKALDLLGHGLAYTLIMYGVTYAASTIVSAIGFPESQTLVDIIRDSNTYAIPTGLSIGRGIYYEIGSRLENWRKRRKNKRDSNYF